MLNIKYRDTLIENKLFYKQKLPYIIISIFCENLAATGYSSAVNSLPKADIHVYNFMTNYIQKYNIFLM